MVNNSSIAMILIENYIKLFHCIIEFCLGLHGYCESSLKKILSFSVNGRNAIRINYQAFKIFIIYDVW
jgi:hypothetical protein